MKRLRASLTLAAGLALAMSTSAGAASTAKVDNKVVQPFSGPTVDKSVALVQLKGDPLSTYVKTKPARGKKIDFNNSTSKSYRAQLSALRNDYKQWLQANAPKAKITGSWDLSLNAVAVQLNGTTLAKVAAAPQVQHAEYEGLYHPLTDDIDLSLIHAIDAWNTSQIGGAANAGAGVKVGVIDTGIDVTHPCFSDAGLPAQQRFGQIQFTNNKVIAARVFYNKQPGRFTAEALQEHGTHVAGTIACDFGTAATVDGAAIPYGISGVAPAALLGSYVVFPGDETTGITNARSEDILNALEAAYTDGMDVVNMSLGGGASGIQDLLTNAVNDLDLANMVVAVAAGNSALGDSTEPHTQAPGHFTVESPGSAARALTAGAFSVGHQVESLVEQGGSTYGTQDGDFAFPWPSDITAPTIAAQAGNPVSLVDNELDGCADYPANSATGKIVLVARGVCSFGQKVYEAEHAGAVAVIVVNRDPAPIPMAADVLFPTTIPAVMVGKADGLALYGNLPDSATITTPQYVSQLDPSTAAFAPASWLQADFSSQGPTDVDYRVKPDVMAPGVNVLSSVPEWDCNHDIDAHCFAFFQGTSMATPHLAGAAAVLIGEHPTWSAWEIRSAVVNSADQGNVRTIDGSAVQNDVTIVGSGSENLLSAVTDWVTLDPVSVSFGAIPSGAGQTLTYTVKIRNESGSSHTFDLTVTGTTGTGVTFSVPPQVTVGGGASATFVVTMTATKGASPSGHQATLSISGTSGTYAHAVLFTYVK
ncbi:MAG TPA: S8 family serine peptidase [Candidatus Limnocylindrales bacterium]